MPPFAGKAARKPAVEFRGVAEFQKALRAVSNEFPKELRKANLEAAEVAASASRSAAQSRGSVQAKAASAIKAQAEQRRAKLTVSATGAYPFALGAFLGSKQYEQFPEWVGDNWEPGGAGGPYAINDALRAKEDEIVDTLGDAVDRLMKRAFPD